MNLAKAFIKSAERAPEKAAIYYGDRTHTYAELHGASLNLARRLVADHKVQPGDRVALWLKNCPEFVPSLFGAFMAGAAVAPINNFLKPPEVQYILENAGINVLITDSAMSAGVEELQKLKPGLQVIVCDDFLSPARTVDRSFTPLDRGIDDLAVLIYTSGTTGRPKGAMLSHRNLLSNVESCRLLLEAVGEDRFVVILPMFHSYVLTVGTFLPMLIGGSMVLVKSLHPPKNMITEIIQHQGTILPCIPQFFRTLTNLPSAPPLPIRVFVSGAAPLPVEVLKQFNEMYKAPLLEGYGLSEASPVVTNNPIRGVRKVGSIGLPIPNVTVTIQDEQGKILGPGEIGEICVKGENVMQGYWGNAEESKKAFRDGWLLTGDIGYRDEDNYFYITDRKKDMLLVNGINVYPREIEETIYRFPGVKEAAVVSQPDPRKGEQPVAFVAMLEGHEENEKAILQFLRSQLADYKVPKRVTFMPALPRNPTGKILKTSLRELVRQSAGKESAAE
ncbi:MAG TPA: long-chain fatty acid--CoA ligase [Methylomirabilota bacterium]|nr:long-chain fatty acid--CoA ligase [Methylomirabilota bacterium]